MADGRLQTIDGHEGSASHDPTPATTGLSQKAAKSFAWAGVSLGANKLLVLVATLVLARLLTPKDFGVVAAGLTVISYLEVGLDLGIGSAVIYEQEKGVTSRLQTAFTLNLGVSAILTAATVIMAPSIAAFFGVPGQADIFRVMSLYLLVHGAGAVNEAVLTRDLLFKKRAGVETTKAGVRGALSVGLALTGHGVWSIVLGFLAGEVAGTALAWILVRFRPRLTIDRGAAASMLKFGLNFVAISLLSELALNSDYLVVGNRLGSVALGYYTMAYRLPELLIGNFFWIFSSVAFPIYAKSRTAGPAAFRQAMTKALAMTALFAFAVGAGLAVISRDAIVVLFSAKWQPAVLPMTILSVAAAVSAAGYASGDLFPAMGRPGTLVAINAPITAVRVLGFILAAPYGIVAVAWVHLACNFTYGFVRLGIANRLVGSRFADNLRAMRPAICVAAGIVVVALPVRLATTTSAWSLLATIGAGTIGGAAGLLAGGRAMHIELGQLARQTLARAST